MRDTTQEEIKMNPYSQTIGKLGFTHESQGDNGWLWLVLSKLSAVDDSESTYAEPVREVMHRLASFDNQGKIAAMLNTHLDKAARQ